MEIKVRIIQKNEIETGTSKAGKEWSKLVFVGETDGQYPKKIAFTAFGKSVEYAQKLKKDQEATVHFDLESREFNDRWFTNVNVWKIDAETQNAAPPIPQTNAPESEDSTLPF
jgi:hypothetical protein